MWYIIIYSWVHSSRSPSFLLQNPVRREFTDDKYPCKSLCCVTAQTIQSSGNGLLCISQVYLVLDYCLAILYFLHFSEEERNVWISKVNKYVDVVADQMKREKILSHMLNQFDLRWTEEMGEEPPTEVTYLHTGSIPSQFGKPLMTIADISPYILR